MRKFGLSLLMLALAVLIGGSAVGCKKGDKGGTADAQFGMSGPNRDPNVEQGNEATAELTINPDKNFKGKIDLKIKSKGDGLADARLSKDSVEITKDEDQNVTLTVKAKDDAPVGAQKVEVTATPPKGNAITTTVTFDVKRREGADNGKTKGKGGDGTNGKNKGKGKDGDE